MRFQINIWLWRVTNSSLRFGKRFSGNWKLISNIVRKIKKPTSLARYLVCISWQIKHSKRWSSAIFAREVVRTTGEGVCHYEAEGFRRFDIAAAAADQPGLQDWYIPFRHRNLVIANHCST
jgi:hypothetical protein